MITVSLQYVATAAAHELDGHDCCTVDVTDGKGSRVTMFFNRAGVGQAVADAINAAVAIVAETQEAAQ